MDTTNSLSIESEAIARQFHIQEPQVRATIELLDEGNTVPFITRYRKDRTGGLNEEQIRQIQEAIQRRRQLNERKDRVVRSIQTQGKLTPELSQQIQNATSLKILEDLYLPYRPKKQTLATVARQRGLEPLALEVLAAPPDAAELTARCEALVDPANELPTAADVLQGVKHLLAEILSERVDLRAQVRKVLWDGQLVSKRIEPSAQPETPIADGWGSETDDADSLQTEDQRAEEEAAILAAMDEEEDAHDLHDSDLDHDTEHEADHDEPDAESSESADAESADAELAETQLGTGPSTANESAVDAERPAGNSDTASEPASGVGSAIASDSEGPTSEATTEGVASENTSASPTTSIRSSLPADDPLLHPAAGAAEIPSFGTPAPKKPAKAARPKANKKNLAEERRQQRRETRHRKRQKLEQSFHDYFNYTEPIRKLPHYRVLAVNRGERCKVLRVKIQADQARLKAEAEPVVIPADHPHREVLSDALNIALSRLVVPSLEREIRRELTERAETHAVRVFARNLRKLLLQPPLRGYRVLAIDPGFRSGCKLVALDEFGNVLGHTLIHVIGAAERVQQSRARLVEQIKLHKIQVVAIGNGTACRETEQLVAGVLAEDLPDQEVHYLIINEAGASVYSTSQIGREELPRHDATVRGAVSIGRRALDPLSELVKIDPANIGVGLYQHDLKAKHLHTSLDAVVESCVNFVGVDLNSASPALLAYVSGLNQLTARRVYEYRQQHGPFRSREQLKLVPGIGEATYVQAAGFLKIVGGDNPLDSTWIHPESYEIAQQILAQSQIELQQLASNVRSTLPEEPPAETRPAFGEIVTDTMAADLASQPDTASPASDPTSEAPSEDSSATLEPSVATTEVDTTEPAEPPINLAERLAHVDVAQLSTDLGVGHWLIQDIVASLARPGRDPREELQPPVFRREVMKLEDLKPGMELSGTVLNVVDFGAFVDIGLTDSGLVHVSRLSDRFVSDPHEVVSVGDVLNVWVVDVDEKRRRVSLTAIEPGKEKAGGHRSDRSSDDGRPAHRRRPQREGARGDGSRGSAPSGQQTAGSGGQQGGGQGSGRQQGQRFGGGQRSSGQRPPARSGAGAGAGGQRPKNKPKFSKPKGPPKPVVPITDAMAQGREPMRTFSDLQQFFQRKKEGDKSDS